MTKQKNAVWRFFVSVKLALAVLIILAVTSVIGTLIKQGQPPGYYLEEYGAGLAKVFSALDLTNMYSSWWYTGLLLLFSINLLVCSIERLPAVWRIARQDNLDITPQRLEAMSCSVQRVVGLTPTTASAAMRRAMNAAGWRSLQQLDKEGSSLLFSQKGAWTRLGVYVVHLSILVILGGAIVGNLFGYQAYVFIPEGRTTSHIFLRETREPFPLGFELRCDRFEKTYYPSGMVKEYRSDLTVLDPELDTPYQKSIIVNDPLSYKGLTFYQGDSYPTQEYFVKISNRATGQEQEFRVPPDREVAWPGTESRFQIAELALDQDGVASSAKISLSDTKSGESSTVQVADKGSASVQHAGQNLTVSFRQYHSTLLLITKDPGVLIVYLGSALMTIGLAISLFLSHRRVWIRITPKGKQGSNLLLSGGSNKNKLGFEQSFDRLTELVEQETKTAAGQKKT